MEAAAALYSGPFQSLVGRFSECNRINGLFYLAAGTCIIGILLFVIQSGYLAEESKIWHGWAITCAARLAQFNDWQK